MGRFIVNLISLALVIIVNTFANILPLNGQSTGEISNRLPVLFTPAGYVFSIWGVIYLLLAIWVFRMLPKDRGNSPLYQTTSILFVMSCVLNILWIFLWHYEFFAWTVVVMIALLLSLIAIYIQIKETDYSLFDLLPFSVYLGWISVATIANISYVLTYYQWNGLGLSNVAWTILMMIVATCLALGFIFRENDWAYPLVIAWALIGIGIKNTGNYPAVEYFSYALSFVIGVAIFVNIRKKG